MFFFGTILSGNYTKESTSFPWKAHALEMAFSIPAREWKQTVFVKSKGRALPRRCTLDSFMPRKRTH
jgi:hypothetical protein